MADLLWKCGSCDSVLSQYTTECWFCGARGCNACQELWVGATDAATGYRDEHWVCETCQLDVNT